MRREISDEEIEYINSEENQNRHKEEIKRFKEEIQWYMPWNSMVGSYQFPKYVNQYESKGFFPYDGKWFYYDNGERYDEPYFAGPFSLEDAIILARRMSGKIVKGSVYPCPYTGDFKKFIKRATERSQTEETARLSFVEEMQTFLAHHGTDKTEVDKLLDYAKRKTGVGFNHYGVKWTAQRDGIECHKEWAGHSFFDDGGGEEGYCVWSISFIALEGNYFIQNEKLNDLSTYRVSFFSPSVSDSFFSKNPFGLNGIYEISFIGKIEKID